MTDSQWRACVRADAVRAGCTPAVADFLAANVGKERDGDAWCSPHDRRVLDVSMAERRTRTTARHAAPSRPATTDERRRGICSLYGAAALLPAFVASRLPLPRVAAILANVSGGHRLTAGGIASVRTQLQAQKHWGAAS